MFIQYYRYRRKYRCEQVQQDPHLQIAYPADEHGMITAAHDFYVIGNFIECEIDDQARLTVELIDLQSGAVVRTVETNRKNGPLYWQHEGIVTQETAQAIQTSGMPDLAYDPENPESFWYTWNKAYYSDTGFSALIYGGSFGRDQICQTDQFGKQLQPLAEGFYEIRVTLQNRTKQCVSAKKVLLATGQKEIILSRFSPTEHVDTVERFSEEQGFEPFTDPYAGIWDPQYFQCPWHSKAYLEVPARWHWGDAQEYESGVVHCFNYNISEECVSYQIEIANMLRQSSNCVDQVDRLKFYYYPRGKASLKHPACEQLSIMPQGRYAFLTGLEYHQGNVLISAVFKPIPSGVQRKNGCEYRILNRIAYVDYELLTPKGKCIVIPHQEVGVWKQKADGTAELLVLQSEHSIWAEDLPEGTILTMIARDFSGKIWDEVTTAIPEMIKCDIT